MLAIGFFCSVVNWVFTGYPGNNYLPWQWLILLPFMLVFLIIAWRVRDIAPRLAFFTRFYTIYYLVIVAMSVMTNGIQYTPFATIDHFLVNFDQKLGFNTAAILAWTAAHPGIKLLFETTYSVITVELFILPAMIAWFKNQNPLNEFLIIISFSYLIGALIYYFFPTAAPSSLVHSPYFLSQEHITALKFFQIHHYIKPSSTDGGLIAFPSFHVLYAVVFVYVTRNKWYLMIPILLINLIGIVSTVMLGWHYLIDVFGGILLAMVSIFIARYLLSKPNSNNCHHNNSIAKI